MRHRIFQGMAWAAVAALSLSMACTDGVDSDAGAAPLYVYDDTSKQVLVWSNVSTLYDLGVGGTVPAPDRTINIGALSSGFQLAWGGMALDGANERLYLVSADGNKVIRILHAATTNGVPLAEDYIIFSIDGTAGSVSNGVFGQAAVNSNGNLVVTENGANDKTQIWSIPYTSQGNGVKVSQGFITNSSGDTACTGVALNGSQAVYAYYNNGDNITSESIAYAGARLRRGALSGGFSTNSSVILDKSGQSTSVTELKPFGSLAFDYVTGSGILYAARQASTDPVLLFTPDMFDTGFQQAPSRVLSGPTDGLLRIIAHPGQKDWLVGAESLAADNTTGAGTNLLWIWKAPSEGDTNLSLSLPDTTSGAVKVLGLALDGSQ